MSYFLYVVKLLDPNQLNWRVSVLWLWPKASVAYEVSECFSGLSYKKLSNDPAVVLISHYSMNFNSAQQWTTW